MGSLGLGTAAVRREFQKVVVLAETNTAAILVAAQPKFVFFFCCSKLILAAVLGKDAASPEGSQRYHLTVDSSPFPVADSASGKTVLTGFNYVSLTK